MSEKSFNVEESNQLNSERQDGDVIERIIEHIGEMGTYQRWLFAGMMPFGFIIVFVYGVQMFVTATPQQHWCRVPELEHLDLALRRNLSIPGAASGLDWNRCLMYDANWTQVVATLAPPANDTPTVPCQHGWEFLYIDIPYSTVVSEREWVCDKSGYAPLAQALFFVGSIIGCGLFGWMGDAYGRVPALIGSNILGCLGGVASIYTTGLWDFIICRFLVGMSNDCCFTMMYIIVLEYVGASHRSWVANMSFALYCGVGGLVLPALALWVSDWRQLLVVTSLPMLIVLTAPWLVPESARTDNLQNKLLVVRVGEYAGGSWFLYTFYRWLASTGKPKRAVEVLKKFERVNKRKYPTKCYKNSSKKTETDESMSALWRSVPLRNAVACLILVSMISSVVIDAIIRLSETIGDNFFVTFAASSAAEILALTLVAVILDRLGRRSVTVGTLSIAGVLSFICAIVPQGLPQLVLAVMVRFCINMSVGVQWQLSAELLPTGVRAMGSSLIHITIYAATALSPFVVYSGILWRPLPLLILCGIGVLGGCVALLLPETKGKPMPQTIADGERLIREGMLCRIPERDTFDDALPMTNN